MKVNTYQELLDTLHNSDPQPNPNFYQILLSNPDIILLEVTKRKQHIVAGELGFTSLPKFSAIMQIIKEFSINSVHPSNSYKDN